MPRRLAQMFLIVLALLSFSTGASAQNPGNTSSAEKEIRALEEERNRAILNGDAAALERMTSDDYTFITLRGELRTKTEIVNGFKSGSFKYEARTISDLNVRVYGDTGAVPGLTIVYGMAISRQLSVLDLDKLRET